MSISKTTCILAMLVAIAVGYISGEYFTERKYFQAIGNQALIDVSRNTSLLETMAESTPKAVRNLIEPILLDICLM